MGLPAQLGTVFEAVPVLRAKAVAVTVLAAAATAVALALTPDWPRLLVTAAVTAAVFGGGMTLLAHRVWSPPAPQPLGPGELPPATDAWRVLARDLPLYALLYAAGRPAQRGSRTPRPSASGLAPPSCSGTSSGRLAPPSASWAAACGSRPAWRGGGTRSATWRCRREAAERTSSGSGLPGRPGQGGISETEGSHGTCGAGGSLR